MQWFWNWLNKKINSTTDRKIYEFELNQKTFLKELEQQERDLDNAVVLLNALERRLNNIQMLIDDLHNRFCFMSDKNGVKKEAFNEEIAKFVRKVINNEYLLDTDDSSPEPRQESPKTVSEPIRSTKSDSKSKSKSGNKSSKARV